MASFTGVKTLQVDLPQRVILVFALAGLLRLVGVYIITKGFSGPGGGWFSYAPGAYSTDLAGDGRLGPAAAWFVWLGLLGIWTGASLWLLGLRPQPTTRQDD